MKLGERGGLRAVVAGLVTGLTFCRGLFDAAGLQVVGYLAQYGALALVVGAGWLEHARSLRMSRRRTRAESFALAAGAVFCLAVLVSWLLTLMSGGAAESWVYVGV